MGLLSRRYKHPRPYMVAEFDVDGLLVNDDGKDVLQVNAPMSPEKAGLLAEMVGDSGIRVSLIIAAYCGGDR